MIDDKIKEVIQRGEERKDRLLKGEGRDGDTIDQIDSDTLAEVTKLLKQQTQECVRENNKKTNKVCCPQCGRETRVNEYGVPMEITTLHYKFSAVRDVFYCRYCQLNFNLMDGYFHNIKRYLNVEVGESMVRVVSEKIGKLIYEKDLERAKKIYEKRKNSFLFCMKRKRRAVSYTFMLTAQW